MGKRVCIALILTLMLIPSVAQARTGQVSIEVDRHIAAVGEPMQVTVNIRVTGQMGYDRYVPPDFNGFQVSGGGMTTQNIEVINWKVSRQEGHTYTVIPLKEGSLAIGPAAIVVQGRKIVSNKVTLKVKKGTAPAPTPPSGFQEEDDEGDELEDSVVPPGRRLERVFITAVADPSKVYVGQQVQVTWYLYTQSDVLGFQTTKQPTTDNFWSEDLHSPRRLSFDRKVVQGYMFYAAVIMRKALFPQQHGKLTVGPLSAQVRTLEQFTSSAKNLNSDTLTIDVLPLPTRGQPSGFSMANVGQFDIMASLDRATVKAGEGVTLKIVVRGNGNLPQLALPRLETLDGFKVYKPKIEDRMENDGMIGGEKIVEHLLLPVRSGSLQVPPLHLDFFDPVKKRYERVSTSPLSLRVTGKMPAGDLSVGGMAKNVIGPTIRPPRPARGLDHQERTKIHNNPIFLTLLLLPVAFVLLVSGGERLRARLTRQTAASMRRTAARQTRGHLARAQELRRREAVREFYGEIAAGIRALLDHRLGVSIEGLTRTELRQGMEMAGYPEELVNEVIEELDACDLARFTPSAASAEEMQRVIKKVSKLIDKLSRVSVRRRRA